MKIDENLLTKVKKEYDNSGGELALSKQEFQEYFGFDQDTTKKIMEDLTATGHFELIKDLDSKIGEEMERFQVHPNYVRNFWLKDVVTMEEAEILLELGALLNQAFNSTTTDVDIEYNHTIGLDLRNQDLVTIPESIGKLVKLEKIILQDNKLTSLPNSICNLKKLKIIDLDRNQITHLPDEICNLTCLEELHLRDNSVKELPCSMIDLIRLRKINLDSELVLNLKILCNLPDQVVINGKDLEELVEENSIDCEGWEIF